MKIRVEDESYTLVAVRQENPNLWLVTEAFLTGTPEPDVKITASGLTDLMFKIRDIVKPKKDLTEANNEVLDAESQPEVRTGEAAGPTMSESGGETPSPS